MHNGLERLCPIDFGDDYGTGFIFAFSYENDEFNGNDLGTEYQSQFFGTVRKITDNDVEDNTLFKSLEHIQVTVESNNDGAGNVYVINGQQKRSLELKTGKSYKFVHPSGHPLSFSENEDGTHNSGTEFTTGVVKSSGETIISINNRTPSNLYYYCDQHSGMGGSISIK